jgi:hypothetical protein
MDNTPECPGLGAGCVDRADLGDSLSAADRRQHAPVSSRLRKNSNCVLRQAQHKRKTLAYSTAAPFVLRLSKDERMVFPHPANVGRSDFFLSPFGANNPIA